MPDLNKTRICAKFEAGNCFEENCRFAHSSDELRSTDFYFKTSLCTWYTAGKCRNGQQCRFAHGEEELRNGPEGESKQATTKSGTKKQTADRQADRRVPNKTAAKLSKAESSKQSIKKGGLTENGAKDSIEKREKQKATSSSSVTQVRSIKASEQNQPMFVQPNSAFLHATVPNLLSSTTRLPEYHQNDNRGFLPGVGPGLPPPQAPFPAYAACYPEACYPVAPQIPVVATSGIGGNQYQDIASLSASIMSLSGKIRQLQKQLTPAALAKTESVANEVKAGHSDSTNSGSMESYSQSQSSGDSSPPSTPPLQHKRDAFSRNDMDLLKLEHLKWQLHLEAIAQGILLDTNQLHSM
jgi:hypothetical protein